MMILAGLIVCLAPFSSAQAIICEQEKWFWGFTGEQLDYAFQVMDVSPSGDIVVVGGAHYKQAEEAVFAVHDMSTGTTLRLFTVAKKDISVISHEVVGVLQLKMQPDESRATALMELQYSNVAAKTAVFVQFYLDGAADKSIRVWQFTDETMIDYSLSMFLMVGKNSQVHFISVDNSSVSGTKIYKFYSNGTVFRSQTALETTQGEVLTLGDAVVQTQHLGMVMVLNLDGGTKAVVYKQNTLFESGSDTYLTIDQVSANAADYKLVIDQSDGTNAHFVTKSASTSSQSVNIYTLDITDSLTTVAVTAAASITFPEVASMTIQDIYYSSANSNVVIVASTATGYVIFDGISVTRVTVDRTLALQPWVFSEFPLVATMGSTNSCQFGISKTHVERLCTSAIGKNCNGQFVADVSEPLVASPLVPVTSTIKLTASGSVTEYQPPPEFPYLTKDVGNQDVSKPADSQIVNPCSDIKPMKFLDDITTVVSNGEATDGFMEYVVGQTSTETDAMCPDPSVPVGITNDNFEAEILHLIDPDGNTVIPDSKMAKFQARKGRFKFSQRERGWFPGQWTVVYDIGFTTKTTYLDWDLVKQTRTTTFWVDPCQQGLTAPPDQALPSILYDPINPTAVFTIGDVALTASASNGQCQYSLEWVTPPDPQNLLSSPPFTIVPPTFTPDNVYPYLFTVNTAGHLTIVPTGAMIGTTLELGLQIVGVSSSIPFTFTLLIDGPMCTENPVLDSSSSPPTAFTLTGDELVIPLNFFSNGDCKFELEISDAADTHATPLTSFTITQPEFSNLDANLPLIIDSITSQGSVLVLANSLDQVGVHPSITVTMVGYSTPAYVFSFEKIPEDCAVPSSFSLPSFDPEYTVLQGSTLDIDLGGVVQDGTCVYTFELTVDSVLSTSATLPTALVQESFELDSPDYPDAAQIVATTSAPKLTVSPTTLDHCNIPGETTTFSLTVYSPADPTKSATQTFQVFVEGALCVSTPTLPTFSDHTYTYAADSIVNEIDLSVVSNGNCAYQFSVALSQSLTPPLVVTEQPQFTVDDPRQPTVVTVADWGRLNVQPNDISHIGSHTVTLQMVNGPSTTFTIVIEELFCVPNLNFPAVPSIEIYATDEPLTMSLVGNDGDCLFVFNRMQEEHDGHEDSPLFVLDGQPTFEVSYSFPTIVVSVSKPPTLTIYPQLDYIGEHWIDLDLVSQETGATLTQRISLNLLTPPPCTSDIQTPSQDISKVLTVGDEETVIQLNVSDSLCMFSLSFSDQGTSEKTLFSLVQPTFTEIHPLVPYLATVNTDGQLKIASPSKADVGVHILKIFVADNTDEEPFLVTIEVLSNGFCEADLQVPELEDVYKIEMSSREVPILLGGASNGSCRYTYELRDEKNQMADPSLFALKQPMFLGEDSERVIEDPGGIIVTPNLPSHVGTYSIVLLMKGQDGSTGVVGFEIQITTCEAIRESKETTVDVWYAVGSGKKSTLVPRANPLCPNTQFFFDTDDLPEFIALDKDIPEFSIETLKEEDAGEYQLKITELDKQSFKSETTMFTVKVNTNTTVTTTVEDDEPGYPEFSPAFFKKKFGYKPLNKPVKPLTAAIYDLTKTGNLTIVFDKPIILPPIELFEEYYKNRKLQEVGEASESEADRRYKNYTLSDVLTIYIESSFYENDAKEIQVLQYNLTRLTPRALDVQILFNAPSNITLSRVEPDILKVDFKMSDLFIDETDFQTFEDKEFFLEYPVVPQFSQEQMEELDEFADSVENSLTTFSIGNLILNIFLAFGLKYLWNMVTLLQFIVFMRQWLVVVPAEADIFLKALKSLALFEFLPTDKISKVLFDWLGIENAKDKLAKEDQSFFDKLAMFFFAALLILVLILFVLGLRLCVKKSERAKRWYEFLKNKLFYNTFIRYILLGTLKIQLTFAGAILIGPLIPETVKEPAPETGFIIFGICVLVVMSLMPVLFGWVLCANRANLKKEVIKKKIGAMYFSLLPNRPYIGSYSVIFLVRRSFFVFTTFALYNYPSMQVECMLYSTILYICYISNMSFYESTNHRRVEIMNECILIGVCYHFVIFANPSFNIGIRRYLGVSCIAFVNSILGVNSIIIIGVNIIVVKRKLMLRRMKKNHAAAIAARLAAQVTQKADEESKNDQVSNQVQVVVLQAAVLKNSVDTSFQRHENGDRKITLVTKKSTAASKLSIRKKSSSRPKEVTQLSQSEAEMNQLVKSFDDLSRLSMQDKRANLHVTLKPQGQHVLKVAAPEPAQVIMIKTDGGQGKHTKKAPQLKMAQNNMQLVTAKTDSDKRTMSKKKPEPRVTFKTNFGTLKIGNSNKKTITSEKTVKNNKDVSSPRGGATTFAPHRRSESEPQSMMGPGVRTTPHALQGASMVDTNEKETTKIPNIRQPIQRTPSMKKLRACLSSEQFDDTRNYAAPVSHMTGPQSMEAHEDVRVRYPWLPPPISTSLMQQRASITPTEEAPKSVEQLRLESKDMMNQLKKMFQEIKQDEKDQPTVAENGRT